MKKTIAKAASVAAVSAFLVISGATMASAAADFSNVIGCSSSTEGPAAGVITCTQGDRTWYSDRQDFRPSEQ